MLVIFFLNFIAGEHLPAGDIGFNTHILSVVRAVAGQGGFISSSQSRKGGMEDPETLWGMKRPVDTGKCSARTLLACFTVFYLSLSSSLSLSLRERGREIFLFIWKRGWMVGLSWGGHLESFSCSEGSEPRNKEQRAKKEKKRKEKWIKISERKNKRLEWPLAFLRVAKWLIKGKG